MPSLSRLFHATTLRLRTLANRRVTFGKDCRVAPSVRFKGAASAEFGDRCALRDYVIFPHCRKKMHFGDEVSIGIFSVIDGTGGLRVGSYVRMGPGVVIYTHNHNIERTDIPISHQGLTPGPVTIEDDVWLGARATILPNVTVGRGSVVAAGAVVTKDVPPFSIVGGVPAKVIAKRKDSDSAPGEAAE